MPEPNPLRTLSDALADLGLVYGATIQSVQRKVHVGTADAMRLLAVHAAYRALAAAQETPEVELIGQRLSDFAAGMDEGYLAAMGSQGKVRGSLPDTEEGSASHQQVAQVPTPHEPSPVAHETPAPRPACTCQIDAHDFNCPVHAESTPAPPATKERS